MTVLPFLALLGITLLWLALPLLPALREWLKPTDLAPLKVVDRSSGYVAYFARNFRQYLERQMTGLPAEAQAGDFFGHLPDGTPFLRVHKQPEAIAREAAQGLENQLVVVDLPASLAGGETFLMELYARAPLVGGPDAVYRAVYAERELTFGARSAVLRWAHAGGRLEVGRGSTMRGRLSSDAAVVLGPEVTFERVGAPLISVGDPSDPPPDPPSRLPACPLPPDARRIGDHLRIDGDFTVPEGTRVTSNLVVAGDLRIGPGAIVEGSVKAHRSLVLAGESQVRGSAVAGTALTVGAAAWIMGPAIAEERILASRDAVIGGPGQPATLSAPVIELESGVTVHGQISAMRIARTKAGL
ncbi:MAG: bactofilin family protein [Gemmatimonadales bacterium]